MKKGIWTIFFMVLLTVVFISVLASINELSKDRIKRNEEIETYKAILYAFNVFPPGISETDLSPSATTADILWETDQLREVFRTRIISKKIPIQPQLKKLLANSYLALQDSAEIFIRFENDSAVAYGFEVKGKGLWGTISAFCVVSSNLDEMVGIDFTEQVETPGLGARIEEIEFKRYFRGLDLSRFQSLAANQPAIIMVKKKKATNIENSTNSLQAITGATQTCSGVLNMLNTDLKFYLSLIRENKDVLRRIN